MKRITFLLALFMAGFAYGQDFNGAISSYLNNNRSQLGLQTEDIREIAVNSQAFSKSMQLYTVHATQQHNGIDIFNSTSSFAIKNGIVVKAASSFSANIAQKVNTTNPSINPTTAINKATQALGMTAPTNLELLETNGNTYLYSNGNISLNEIPVKLVYQTMEDEALRLSWDLSIYLKDASHYYSVRIDAQNGQLLSTHDWVVSCNFGDGEHAHSGEVVTTENFLFRTKEATNISFDAAGGAQYRVFAQPLSNPLDGADTVVTSPEDATASPFGWHDTDGAGGAEYEITRGNNVWAQEDQNANNGTGAAPSGGPTLNFDFPYLLDEQPGAYVDAATTNLFYWNNIIHDITYHYGFDEANGNFQENNYGNGGAGSDSVNADAQDGGGTNNANFGTPPDGSNPRMQMFLWSAPGGAVDILTINNGPLAGTYSGVPATFGGALPVPPLTEDLVLIEDDDAGASTDPNDGCDNITNAGDLNGKIVVIRRGECEFGFKGLAAQDEGAVAVIIVNNVAGAPIAMAPGDFGAQVTIPMFMISNTDGDPIIAELAGNNVNGTISGENVQPMLDGDLDNEIVAHEYGHGVSNRLTAGPTNTGCLQNDEQMGEGWSDYLGLILTMQPGDTGEDVRGLAAYAAGQGLNGQGIREAPYSIDFAINDFTYADTNNNVSQPHGIGFVWATMLWDMTWLLIDEYGFDEDIYNGTGGNNIAFQLVMDGMKLQPCNPGFVTGRDAILEADDLANGGANRCLIWTAFANRGLGFSASQGSQFSRSDQVEAFDLPSECNLGIEEGNLDNNFRIYPNPSDGIINIDSIVNLGTTEVSIFDMNGRKVFTQTMELGNRNSIDASGITTGVYLMKIDGDSYTHTAKLIIR